MPAEPTRREMLSKSLTAAGAAAVLAQTTEAPAAERPEGEPFIYCFNTSTIRGQKLPLPRVIEIVARAGFRGIEPWVSEIDDYVKAGGSLDDLKKQFSDHGLTVESVIGFAEWVVDDDQRRAKGLEEARRLMDMTVRIGGKRIAAPPAGVPDRGQLDLVTMAGRYQALLELGEQLGVVPQLELWGFSPVLSKLSQAAFVAIEAGHPNACILADSYHLYKGGSEIAGLHLLSGKAMHVFHINDYPGQPDRTKITDAERVFPGDGVAPLGELLRTLNAIGFRGALSLEVFNREYWNQDPLLVARTGFEKTRETVRKALA